MHMIRENSLEKNVRVTRKENEKEERRVQMHLRGKSATCRKESKQG